VVRPVVGPPSSGAPLSAPIVVDMMVRTVVGAARAGPGAVAGSLLVNAGARPVIQALARGGDHEVVPRRADGAIVLRARGFRGGESGNGACEQGSQQSGSAETDEGRGRHGSSPVVRSKGSGATLREAGPRPPDATGQRPVICEAVGCLIRLSLHRSP
jgi:hypothetical protein